MSRWTEPSPSDFDRWEALVAEGKDPSRAAKELGFNGSSAFKRVNQERHAEVLALSRDVREGVANERGEKWALAEEGDARLKLAYLKAESPRYREGEHSHLEISGPDSGAIPLEGRVVTRLEHVVRLAIETGQEHLLGLPPGSIGALLPAAQDVLPDPVPGDQAPGDGSESTASVLPAA